MCSSFVTSVKLIPNLEVDRAVSDLGGSEDLYEKMFRLVLRLIPQNIGQMDEYLYIQGNLGAFAIKVHGTKGSLNQVGNKKLGQYAELLEQAAKSGDREYCAGHYGNFKTQLLLFCSQVEDVISKNAGQEDTGENEDTPLENIREFFEDFQKAKDAIEDYDSITALDILTPLAKRRFGGKADKLVGAALEALEMFNLQTALENILKLQKEYIDV